MEGCMHQLQILNDKDGYTVLILRCADGRGHEGQHQAGVWTTQFNQVTKKIGKIMLIQWD